MHDKALKSFPTTQVKPIALSLRGYIWSINLTMKKKSEDNSLTMISMVQKF